MGGICEDPKEAIKMSSKRKPVGILKVNSRLGDKNKPREVLIRPRSSVGNKVTIIA